MLFALLAASSALRSAPPARARPARMMADAGFACSFVAVQPTLVLDDYDAAKPILAEFVAKSKGATAIFCGWSSTRSVRASDVVGSFREGRGDRLTLRQAYPDGAAALAHLQDVVAPTLEALLAGPASGVSSMELHGPPLELERLRAAVGQTSGAPATCFATEAGVSFMEKEAGGVPQPLQMTSVHSTFEVTDWTAVEPILADFVERTRKNEKNGCVFSSFSRSGTTLHCREAYGSPSAIAKHVENVAPCTEALLSGPATLTSTAIHGSQPNLKAYQDNMRQPGVYGAELPDYFYKGSADERGFDGGFSRFELQQSLFGFSF